MSKRKIIMSEKAPKPVGPYNQAILLDNILYVSGCIGLDTNMKLIDGGVIEETKQALKNLGYILDEAGSSYDNIIKTTLYLEDMDDFVNVNEIYKEMFKTNYPARSTIQVAKLPLNAKFEIEAIAIVGDVITEISQNDRNSNDCDAKNALKTNCMK